MRKIGLVAGILIATLLFTSLSACSFTAESSSELIPITPEEEAVIEAGQSEGKDELQIAEELTSCEEEIEETKEASDKEVVADEVIEEGINSGNSGSSSGSAGGNTIPSPEPAGRTANTPAANPSGTPSTGKLTNTPTAKPTGKPTTIPTAKPTGEPTKIPTAKPTEAVSDEEFMSAVECECVRLINEFRKQKACDKKETFYVPLVLDSSLVDKAHIRCREITSDFSHDSSSGNKLSGEAIYRGTATSSSASQVAAAIVNSWKNSSGHYSLIITGCVAGDGSYASMNCGLGVLKKNGNYYAVFGTSSKNSGTSPSSGYTGPTNTPTPTATPSPVRVTYRVAEGHGRITETRNGNDTVTLTAVPDDGWMFAGWYDHRFYAFSGDPTVTITRDNDGIAIQAVFIEKPKATPSPVPSDPVEETEPAEPEQTQAD